MADYYQDEVGRLLAAEFDSGQLRIAGDSEPVFEQLQHVFPIQGSRIAWPAVPGSIERVAPPEPDEAQASTVAFFDELVRSHRLAGRVTYVSDNAIDFAIEGELAEVRNVLPRLLEALPQHHYLVGANHAWCMSFTMEGDLAFGFRP